MEDFEDDYENEDYENDEEYLEELHEEEDKRRPVEEKKTCRGENP